MHKTVKRYADNADIKGLKYIFVDCLDADPTFEDYREDFEYCKNIPGLFEEHMELTPFRNNPAGWDENYWIGLKKDLLKNFSMKRFQHMRKVAEVFYKEKIYKIQKERGVKKQQERELEETEKRHEPEKQQTESYRRQEERTYGNEDTGLNIKSSEQDKREKEEAKRRLELENQRTESYRRYEEEQRRNREKERIMNEKAEPDVQGKKVLGVVLIIIVILIIVLLIIQME